MAKQTLIAGTAQDPQNGRRKRTKLAEAQPGDGPAELLSKRTRKLVDGIRDEFDAYVGGFAQLMHDRDSLAPKFIKAFEAWQEETKGTFIGFVRVLDPRVPEDRDGYKAHPTYAAADYLRRKTSPTAKAKADVPDEDKPVSAYHALAFLVATVMPIVDPTRAIWRAFVREMNWTDEQAERLQVLAAKLGPVALPPSTKHQLRQRTGAAA